MYSIENADGSWTLFHTVDGMVHAYSRQDFVSENAALLFAAMNPKLLARDAL